MVKYDIKLEVDSIFSHPFPGVKRILFSRKLLSDKTDYGNTIYDGDIPVEVILNSKICSLKELVGTFIHEHLHVKYPDMPHKVVQSLTSKIQKSLSRYEQLGLLRILFKIATVWEA